MTSPSNSRPFESYAGLRTPWFLKPVPAFVLVQTVPLSLWLLVSDRTFGVALHGHERAQFGIASTFAYGVLILAFTLGARLGARAGASLSRTEKASFQPILKAGHYVAAALAAFSCAYVLFLAMRTGISVFTVILAAQANLFRQTVYSSSAMSQILIMGRHLVLVALITWFGLGLQDLRRPRTLPVIVISSVVLFVFTSSRLTVESLFLTAALFWLSTRARKGGGVGARYIYPVLVLAGLLLVFGAGVWIRSLGTWQPAAGSALGGVGYEAVAYLISPVNYSVAFVEEGVALVRGLGLNSFFSVVYTIFNLPVNDSFREGIRWYYYPSLNQLGLLGEWFTIMGPLLWIPALFYGIVAEAAHTLFQRNTPEGVLLYPIVLISVLDSVRGFLLPQNILAANIVFAVGLLVIGRGYSTARVLRVPRTGGG